MDKHPLTDEQELMAYMASAAIVVCLFVLPFLAVVQ